MVLTMLISNSHLSIRALRMEDKDILVKWMSNPTVLQYYQGRDEPLDMEKVTKIFYDPDTEDVQSIIEYEGVPIGYIQYYLLDEESRQTYGYQNADEIIYGMDQFIGEPEYWNRGIGTLLIQTMITS
jgi:aminoglycoside 6'-N-acetyltransferase